MDYMYQVVPFIGNAKGDFTQTEALAVAAQLERAIAAGVEKGWEFYRVDKVNINVAPGCLGRLFGASSTVITYDQIIFRRPA